MAGKRIAPDEAIEVVENCFTRPDIRLLAPGGRLGQVFCQMILNGQVSGPQITGAALAALAIQPGGTIYSSDRDFARFPGLKWVNPLDKAERLKSGWPVLVRRHVQPQPQNMNSR